MANYDRSQYRIADLYDLLTAERETRLREQKLWGEVSDGDDEYGHDELRIKPEQIYVLLKYTGGAHATVPDGVSIVKSGAFRGNTTVRSIVLPDSVREVEPNAFAGCTALESIRLSESMKKLAFGLFEGCAALRSVRIPHSVRDIESGTFKRSGSERICIPAGVCDIAGDAFAYCDKLISIEIAQDNAHMHNRDNCIYLTRHRWLKCGCNDGALPSDGSISCIYDDAFEGNMRVTECVVPEGVEHIGNGAFAHCKNLSRVALPESLRSIGAQAFGDCHSLAEITIPHGVEKLDRFAFAKSGLKKIVIKRGAKEIDEGAFFGCAALAEVYIPNTVTSVQYDSFDGCPASLKIYTEHATLPHGWDKSVSDLDITFACDPEIFD